MLTARPREREWVSWLLAGLWALAIFGSVPLAVAVRELVRERFGLQVFAYLTLVAIAAAAAAAVRYLARRCPPVASYGWLALVAVVYAGYTIYLWRQPEEALHFVEYGILGVLAYRALSHRVRDRSIYAAALLLGASVALVDELLQWLAPGRFWDPSDVWIDVLAVALAQVAIAGGLRPAIVAGPVRPASVRMLCRAGMLLLAALAATLMNSPRLIAWYSERVPALAFLRSNESVMIVYGHRLVDREAGPFRSQLSAEELRRVDHERGVEAARILDRFREPAAYRAFVESYTPLTDPFVREAYLHRQRRDQHLEWSSDPEHDEHQQRVHATVAWRENRILETYFPRTLRHSGNGFPAEQVTALERRLLPEGELPEHEVEGSVSRGLVTAVSARQVAALLGLAFFALVWIDRRHSGRVRTAR